MNYGRPLGTYEPVRYNFYAILSDYYENLSFVKLKDVEKYSMYICKVHSLLSKDFRYLIAMTNKDNHPPGYKVKLEEIPWKIFQSRTLPDNHTLPLHNYDSRRGTPLDSKINVIKRTKESTTYLNKEFSLEITLLHVRDREYEYPDSGSIVSALETFQTILRWR